MRALLDAEKHGSWYADLTTVAVTLRVVDEISRAAYEIKAKNVYAMQRNAGPILVIPTAHKLRLNRPKEGLDAEKVKWKYSLSGTVLRLIELESKCNVWLFFPARNQAVTYNTKPTPDIQR